MKNELLEALKRIERTDLSTVGPDWLRNFCRAMIAEAECGKFKVPKRPSGNVAFILTMPGVGMGH